MKALVVDNDRVLADVVAFTLRREGFEVVLAYDGLAGLQRWQETQPDLVVLDVNMPKMDGFEVCRRIRAEADTPILLLTVRGEEDDIVAGLELGADDYIIKPFSPRQLVARARAILRRAGGRPTPVELEVGDLRLVSSKREVYCGSQGEPVSLTHLENRLLECLMINAGRVLTFDSIIDQVWGPAAADRDMLRQLVHRLRAKIEPDVSRPDYIQTVPGLGYGLNK
jgi:DNA-binding response OmpR family regulator